MLYIDQHKHIKSRADFFRTLEKALQSSNDLLKVAPGDRAITSILRQLEMTQTWTENGREPTKDERWKPQISILLSREFETVSDRQIVDWAELCRETEGYFCHWLEDAAYQTVDEDDLPLFADEEDDVTHLLA